MHYLGNYIKADEQLNLKENLRLMAYEDKIEAGNMEFVYPELVDGTLPAIPAYCTTKQYQSRR